uniref:C-type lectin domain-containing protein n=1 Tax=Oryzias melastigma TaxID=30732 RepID=A0A3B3B8T0_ORYME
MDDVPFNQDIFILSSCLLTRQYYFENQRMNWTEAQTYCRQKYTDLATITNSEEMDEVRKVVLSTGYGSDFRIGLHNNITWRWSDGYTGSLVYTYSYWSPEDSFHSRSDRICMTTDWQYSTFTWLDASCDSLLPFVCYQGMNFLKIYLVVKYQNLIIFSAIHRNTYESCICFCE